MMASGLYSKAEAAGTFAANSVQAQRTHAVMIVVIVIVGLAVAGFLFAAIFHIIARIFPIFVTGIIILAVFALFGWMLNAMPFAEVCGGIAFGGTTILFLGALCDVDFGADERMMRRLRGPRQGEGGGSLHEERQPVVLRQRYVGQTDPHDYRRPHGPDEADHR